VAPVPVSRSGFTLVEVLVAMVVAVAAFSILAQGFTTGGHAAAAARSASTAAALAQRVLCDLESGVLAPDQSTSGAFEDEPDFKYATRSSADEPGLRLIEVSVTWTEMNQERSFVLTRLLRERTATTP
jgi:prepilin-type N-terminal cleavage/methylation domain-containing protein